MREQITRSHCRERIARSTGKPVTGQDLTELFTGATVSGGSYARKQRFLKRYHPDGSYEIAFSKDGYWNKFGKTHRGRWRIEGDQVCYKVASLNSDGCALIYRQQTQIEFVSPKTGKATFFSSWIEYEGKKIPAPGAAPETSPPQASGESFTPPSPGSRIHGDAIARILSGEAVHSRQKNPRATRIEYFYPDGTYLVQFSVERKNLRTGGHQREFTGSWHTKRSALCLKLPDLGQDECYAVYSYGVYGGILFASATSSEVYAYSTRIDPVGAPNTGTPSPKPSAPKPIATPAPPEQAAKLKPVGSGSGFIVSNDTYVLTNAHVIKGCRAVTVMFDGRDVPATVKARGRQNDLALLRLPAGKHPVAVFQGDYRLYPGDSVMAIGYPLSEVLASEGTVSVGIVNALAGLGNNASLLQISNPIPSRATAAGRCSTLAGMWSASSSPSSILLLPWKPTAPCHRT